MARTCSGWRRAVCRRWATGSAPAAIGRITRASGMPRTRISTPTMATGTCCRSTTTGRRSTRTSGSTWMPICSTSTASRSGGARSARTRQAQHGRGQGPVHRRRDDRAAQAPRHRSDRRAVADGLLVPEPHDDSLFGAIALAQGLRYHPSGVPHVEQAPTRDEDLSTKPSCQQSYVDNWRTIIAPQPWNELHLKFYYQMQAEVGRQITRVLDALRECEA